MEIKDYRLAHSATLRAADLLALDFFLKMCYNYNSQTGGTMAILNGQDVDLHFDNLSSEFHIVRTSGLKALGERLLDASPTGDGKGIKLVLTKHEESILFCLYNGHWPARWILMTALIDAIERKTGQRPLPHYTYDNENRVLTTD